MKKKAVQMTSILVFGFLLSTFVLFSFNEGQEESGNNNGSSENNSDHQTAEETKSEDDGRIQERADISFKKYKHIYQSWQPKELLEFDKDDVCKKKGDDFGYTFVEFVFLEKLEDGSLKPYSISSIKFEDLQFNRSCPGAAKHFIRTRKKYATCRIRFAVVNNCKKCPDVLVPGQTYRFYEFEGPGEVDYKFKVPEADRLDFVSPDSDRDPKVFRYPVLVNDIRKTRKVERTPRNKVTLTIRNGVSSHPSSKIGNISNVLVKYEGKNFVEKTKGVSENGNYTLELNVPERRKIYGGDVKVFGVLDKSEFVPDRYEKKSNMIGLQMLMYKQQIQSKQIDMAEGLSYRHQPEKTVGKEISLNSLFKKGENDALKKSPSEVELKKVYWDKEKAVIICKSVSYLKDGNWYTTLEAPPGEYALVIGNQVIKKRFKWPPEKTAEEQGGKGEEEN